MKVFILSLSLLLLTGACNRGGMEPVVQDSIDISKLYPSYWSFDGSPVLLLGGSDEDNLFQMPGLEEHLDRLVSVGGNYVRNTLSGRDSGNLWPFYRQEDGLYDLNRWNELYWNRLENFLALSAERSIIVQMELWATFDFYRGNWLENPFNPVNNINYDERRSKLSPFVETHPVFTENNFFRSVPRQMALARVLDYQKKFVDKVLFHSLKYDHVLYCMDNETSVNADWGQFWAEYIRKKALLEGKKVHTTEMWDPWDLSHPFHFETFDHPEYYSFVDISQNNHNSGDEHWENGLRLKEYLKFIGLARPMNNVKIYGNDGGRHQTTRNAIESFIRNIFMGSASARFHRPPSGQGLNEVSMGVIKSMRSLTEQMNWFLGGPANVMLKDRDTNEAFCRCWKDHEAAVYFTNGGSVKIDLSGFSKNTHLAWLEVMSSSWNEPEAITPSENFELKAPGEGHWICLVKNSEFSLPDGSQGTEQHIL